MIASMSRVFSKFIMKYLPDPITLAALLAIVVFILSFALTPATPLDLIGMWGNGFWGLIAFSMQMALIVVTGSALASSPPIKKVLVKVASIAKTPTQGVMLVVIIGMIGCLINWGFGLVLGAIMAKEVARKVPGSDYRLLVASAYIAFLVWENGISGSIALSAATEGNPLHELMKDLTPGGLLPMTETTFAPFNIVTTIILLISLPILVKFMMPPENERIVIDPALLVEGTGEAKKPENATPAEKLDWSRLLAYIIGGAGLIYVIWHFASKGFALDINLVNFIFVNLGILIHGSLIAYMNSIKEAIAGAAGIIAQFPFYAGIQLMMDDSGLGALITQSLVDISNQYTFLPIAFLTSGLINFAVPSGGGHWVVQGPFIMPAAAEMNVDLGAAAMAIAYGDAWTNMIQPFWALPALAIAGLKARDIMGFCLTAMLFATIPFVLGLMLSFVM